jgi:hypothetical protein
MVSGDEQRVKMWWNNAAAVSSFVDIIVLHRNGYYDLKTMARI